MYTTFYDVLSQPDKIHPVWGYYVVHFLIFGLLLLVGALGLRFWGIRGKVFLVVCGLVTAVAVYGDYRDYRAFSQARDDVRDGHYQIVEGCLEHFHPGAFMSVRNGKTDETWSVDGVDFTYGSSHWGPGYSQTTGVGSLLDKSSRVRVSYIIANMPEPERRIVRLEIQPNTCPPAPDIST